MTNVSKDDPASLLLRTNTMLKKPPLPKGRSVKQLGENYLQTISNLMYNDRLKVLQNIHEIDTHLDDLKRPMLKYLEPEGNRVLADIGPVLTKEWEFCQCDMTKFALNKYKAKDFHLPEVRTTKSISLKMPLTTSNKSTGLASWMRNRLNAEYNKTENVDKPEEIKMMTKRDRLPVKGLKLSNVGSAAGSYTERETRDTTPKTLRERTDRSDFRRAKMELVEVRKCIIFCE